MIPPAAGENGRPLRALRHFIHLSQIELGQRREPVLPLSAHDFVVANPNGDLEAVSGEWTMQIGNDGRKTSVTVI